MARPKKLTTPSNHKRRLSESVSATPGSRSSKRLKDVESHSQKKDNVTPKKSKYFEGSDSEDFKEESPESGYEDEEASASEPSPSPSETEDDIDSEEDTRRRKPKPKRPPPAKQKTNEESPTDNSTNKELWRPGVKTGLGPGKQVFIAKPKPKGDRGIKYTSDRIHPNTMEFLADLKRNNDREWFKMHDPDYRQSWNDWSTFVESLTEKITEVDETIPDLPPKDLVFRIYRDVRFSSDQTPYKPHFSAAWSRTGRKGPYACYYVQIMPGGKSFIGSGLWMPDAQPLGLVRRAIDRKSQHLKAILMNPGVRKTILGGISNDEKKVVKAFASHNSESALKTKPKGYEADNPNIELLRLRSFTMGRRLPDSEILGAKYINTVAETIQLMMPFVTYLNGIVMPDDDEQDSSSDEDEARAEDSTEGSPEA